MPTDRERRAAAGSPPAHPSTLGEPRSTAVAVAERAPTTAATQQSAAAPSSGGTNGDATEASPAADGAEPTAGASAEDEGPPAAAPPAVEVSSAVRRSRGVPLTAQLVTLVAIEAIVFFAFLLIEPTPRWLALFGAVVVALSFEGVLRSSVREPFASGADTMPYLFLPTLYALVMPVFAEHTAGGWWVLAIGAALVAGFAAVLVAEIGSVRARARAHRPSRVVAALGAYVVAFALFDLGYLLELDVPGAMVASAIGAGLLGIELLREGEIDPLETLGFAAIVGLIAAESRWTLHFLPIEGGLAALALLLVFYVSSGLLHAHLTRQLSARAAGEYAAIAAAGLALVIGARAGGIA
jgi:hypothetical protein